MPPIKKTVVAPPVGKTASTSAPKAAQFKALGKLDFPLEEASDLVALPNGGFLGVSDTADSALIRGADGRFTELKLEGVKNGKSGLEGVAYDPVRKLLLVAKEEKGELLRYSLSDSSRPRLEETLELDLGGSRNKGIEGLSFLPAKASPTGKDQLLAVKEGDPMALLLLPPDGRGKPVSVALDSKLTSALKDFSGVTVDPKTGHVFIASDESGAVSEVTLSGSGSAVKATLVGTTELRDEKGKKISRVEGITFDAKGDLYVMPENGEALIRFGRV